MYWMEKLTSRSASGDKVVDGVGTLAGRASGKKEKSGSVRIVCCESLTSLVLFPKEEEGDAEGVEETEKTLTCLPGD